MLDLAINHEDTLKKKMVSIMFDEKYKFFNDNSHYSEFKVDKENIGWNNYECVSVLNGEVLGYFRVRIDVDCGYYKSLVIVNFSDNKIVFGKDLVAFLNKIFSREDMYKLCFSVVVGNPIEKTYDKFVSKYGGSIVGKFKKHAKLFDGKLYDMKSYEIFREDFIKNTKKEIK